MTILAGDCRALMPAHAPFDMIVADPPYGDTSLAWDRRVDGWLPLARETLRPSGSIWVFGSLPSFMATADQFSTAGFRYAQEIVWEKQNGSSFHADRFKRVHELVVQFYRADVPWSAVFNAVQTKPDATARTVRRKRRPPHTGHIEAGHYVSTDGGPRLVRSVIYARNCHGRATHPTEKPSALLEILIRTSCPEGGLVGDWFAGSGAAARSTPTWRRAPARASPPCCPSTRAARHDRTSDASSDFRRQAARAVRQRISRHFRRQSMSGTAASRGRGDPTPNGPALFTTLVELTWHRKKIENWIRFGRKSYEQILDRRRSVVGFAPNSIFAFVRWASNDFGTIVSRIDIVRAIGRGEPFQTLPFVRPGGDILLRLDSWARVERALQAIDAVEALGLDPADVAPEHWRHVHNRLIAGHEPRAYTPEQHAAWLKRRRIAP